MATTGGFHHGNTAFEVKLFCASITHASIRLELATILSHNSEFKAFKMLKNQDVHSKIVTFAPH
jgi:hypothetical protein